jgi:hypothetical protein
VTSLASGLDITNGTVVANGRIDGTSGESIPFDIVAGADTAEWAFRFPSLQNAVKHVMPQVYRAWTVQQPDGTISVAQNYITYVELPPAFTPQKLTVEFVTPSDAPPNLTLDLSRVILYTTQPSTSLNSNR